MLGRQKQGSVLCAYCRQLVGVNDKTCFHCGRRNPSLWGFGYLSRYLGEDLGFTNFVVFGCVGIYVISLLMDPGGIGFSGFLRLFSPSGRSLFLLGASGAAPVFGLHRPWTVLSASFLHGGLIHIAFNMMWAKQLIPVIGRLYGPGKAVIIYTVASIVGFSASSLMGLLLPGVAVIGGAQWTLGASAAIFGLLGAMVFSGGAIGAQATAYALVLGIFGLVMEGVDNWGHLGGFIGGYLAARLLRRMPDTPGHVNIAFGCMAAFALSILASVIFGWNL